MVVNESSPEPYSPKAGALPAKLPMACRKKVTLCMNSIKFLVNLLAEILSQNRVLFLKMSPSVVCGKKKHGILFH